MRGTFTLRLRIDVRKSLRNRWTAVICIFSLIFRHTLQNLEPHLTEFLLLVRLFHSKDVAPDGMSRTLMTCRSSVDA